MFDFDDLEYHDTSYCLESDMCLLRPIDLEQIRIYVGLPSSYEKDAETQNLISDVVEGNIARACAVVNERELELASHASLLTAPDKYANYLTAPLPFDVKDPITFLGYVYENKLQVNQEFTLWYVNKLFSAKPLGLENTPYPVLCKGRFCVEYLLGNVFYHKGNKVDFILNDHGASMLRDFSDISIVNGVTMYQNGYSDIAHYIKPKMDGIQVISLYMQYSASPADYHSGMLIHYDNGYKNVSSGSALYDSIEYLNDKYYISRRDFYRLTTFSKFPYEVVDITSISDTDPLRPDTDGFILGTLFHEYKIKPAHTIDLQSTEGAFKTCDGVRVATAWNCVEGAIYECDLKGNPIRLRPDKTFAQNCKTIADYKRLPTLSDYQETVVACKTPYKEYVLPSFHTLRTNGISKIEHLRAFEKNYFILPQEYKDRFLCIENCILSKSNDISSLIEICSSVVGSHRIINTDTLMYTVLESGYSFSPLALQEALHRGGCFRSTDKWYGPLVVRRARYDQPVDARFNVYRIRAKKYEKTIGYMGKVVEYLSCGDRSTMEVKKYLASDEGGNIIISLKALNKSLPTHATRRITSTGSVWYLNPPGESCFIAAIVSELEANNIGSEEKKLEYVKDRGYADPGVVVTFCSILSLLRKGMSLLVAIRILLKVSRDEAHTLVCDTLSLYDTVLARYNLQAQINRANFRNNDTSQYVLHVSEK